MRSVEFIARQKVNKKDFTRNRTWGFFETFVCILTGLKKSLAIQVSEFLTDIGSDYVSGNSKQAFSQARQKLKPEGFIELNDDLIRIYYSDDDFKKYKGYRLMGIDGSDVRVPNTPEIIKRFGLCSGIPMASMSMQYDVLNKFTLDASLDPYKEGNERKQALVHFNKVTPIEGVKDISLFDRGYPDMGLICAIISKGSFFVMRFNGKNFIKAVSCFAQEDGPLDNTAVVDLTTLSRIVSDKILAYRDKLPESITLRVVRLPRTEGEEIFLLTNLLDHEVFPTECFEELYHHRWGIETGYNYLKTTLELENFAAKTTQGVMQEFNATVLCANINQLVVEEAQEILALNKKPERKINKTVSTGLTRGQLLRVFFSKTPPEVILDKLAKQVAKNTIRVDPGRSFTRKVKPPSKYHITKRRAF
jgi:hypothetical protein